MRLVDNDILTLCPGALLLQCCEPLSCPHVDHLHPGRSTVVVWRIGKLYADRARYSHRLLHRARCGAAFLGAVAASGQCLCLWDRSEEHTSELQSLRHLVCRLLLEKK